MGPNNLRIALIFISLFRENHKVVLGYFFTDYLLAIPPVSCGHASASRDSHLRNPTSAYSVPE
jgi:hypothetical protein